MKLRILNRNKLVEYPSTEIDFKSYNIDEGFNITETKNETLDSAFVVISNVEEINKIEIEPFDIVRIEDELGDVKKYMCVDTYVEQMICVNPKIYRYEINLFSQTKLLEGIILPNLKITKVFGVNRSIWYYINQYLTEYCPKIRVETPNSYTFEYKMYWNELEDYFDDTECPEMQWNTPTLREVLNDLMMVKDCIPIVKRGVVDGTVKYCIDFMNLTDSPANNSNYFKNITTDEHINYVTRSKSSEDYVSELQIKLENVTDTDSLVTHIEYYPFTNPEDNATLTTNNLLVKTRYPIYKLKSLTIMYPGVILRRDSENNINHVYHRWISYDLMDIGNQHINLVCEYQEYITKSVLYNTTTPNISVWPKYQNWSLYYTRGTNEIVGWYSPNKWLWMTEYFLPNLNSWLQYLKGNEKGYPYEPAHVDVSASQTPVKFYNYFFKVEYETLEGCVFRASKNEAENDRVVIDNQTNSYVDSYKQGFLEYQKVNRLGNEQLQINARYPLNYSEHRISISDTYEDCIIYQTQYQYFKDHVEVNALATKNYILREYFTGVKSKIRSWRISSGSEALTRHDLLKYYCTFSFKNHGDPEGLEYFRDNPRYNLAEYLLSPLDSERPIKPLKNACVRTYDSNNNIYPQEYNEPSYYSIDLISRVVGNSLVFTFEMLDNYWAGKSFSTYPTDNYNQDKYISASDIQISYIIDLLPAYGYYRIGINSDKLVGGGVPMRQYAYTDDNGENIRGEIVFIDGITSSDDYEIGDFKDNDVWADDSTAEVVPGTENFIYGIYQKLRIYERNFFAYNQAQTELLYNYEKMSLPFSFKKDSQEITNISTQFEFRSDTKNICFSKEFLKRQQAVSSESNSHTFYLKQCPKSVYDFRNPDTLPSVITRSDSVDITIESLDGVTGYFDIKINRNFISRIEALRAIDSIKNESCLYLVDENDNVLLAFNPNNELHSSIEFIGNRYYNVIELYLSISDLRNYDVYTTNNYYIKKLKL